MAVKLNINNKPQDTENAKIKYEINECIEIIIKINIKRLMQA